MRSDMFDVAETNNKQIEQIEFWKKNPDVFVEKYYNIKLLPYQKTLLKLIDKTPVYLLLRPRRKLYFLHF